MPRTKATFKTRIEQIRAQINKYSRQISKPKLDKPPVKTSLTKVPWPTTYKRSFNDFKGKLTRGFTIMYDAQRGGSVAIPREALPFVTPYTDHNIARITNTLWRQQAGLPAPLPPLTTDEMFAVLDSFTDEIQPSSSASSKTKPKV